MKMGSLEKYLVNRKRRAQRNVGFAREILSRIPLEGVKDVLEVGCGVGALAGYLSGEREFAVTGTDLDPGQIALAKRNFKEGKRLSFIAADVRFLPFEGSQFDMILSLKVLHHIPQWQDALKEIIRILRPGGYFVLNDIVFSRPLARFMTLLPGKAGLYNLETLASFVRGKGLSTALSQKPVGFLFKHFTLVFRKPVPSVS
jgi:ubiquinone/menaquinone biosynthesis C-methylase UbiE